MCKAEKYITTILTAIAEVERVYKANQDGVYQKDRETQDLLHEIELSNFNACQGYRLAKELQSIRSDRRSMKDENETLEILYEFIQRNPQFKNGLTQCHQNVKKRELSLENREYRPRVRNDLTIVKAANE